MSKNKCKYHIIPFGVGVKKITFDLRGHNPRGIIMDTMRIARAMVGKNYLSHGYMTQDDNHYIFILHEDERKYIIEDLGGVFCGEHTRSESYLSA